MFEMTRRQWLYCILYADGQTAEEIGCQFWVSRDTVLSVIKLIRARYVKAGFSVSTKWDFRLALIADGRLSERA